MQVQIAPEHRRLNSGGRDCVWNAVTTLCRHHGVAAGADIDEKHGNAVRDPRAVAGVLRRRGVEFRWQSPGVRDVTFLKKWVRDRKAGCLVGLSGPHGPRHAVVCVHFDDIADVAAFVENEGPLARLVLTKKVSQFLTEWDGWAVAIVPPSAARHAAAPADWLLMSPLPRPSLPAPFSRGTQEKRAKAVAAVGRLDAGRGTGSATVVAPALPDGRWRILTCAHAVPPVRGHEGTLTLKDGRVLRVKVESCDQAADVAWLETVEAHATLPAVRLASGDPAPGDGVWHCGYATGGPGVVRRGTVTRSVFASGAVLIDGPVDHGDSGGGLFNSAGELVGVMTGGIPDRPPDPWQPGPRGPYRLSVMRPLSRVRHRPLPRPRRVVPAVFAGWTM